MKVPSKINRETTLPRVKVRQTERLVEQIEKLLNEHNEPYRTIAEAIVLGTTDNAAGVKAWLAAAIRDDL